MTCPNRDQLKRQLLVSNYEQFLVIQCGLAGDLLLRLILLSTFTLRELANKGKLFNKVQKYKVHEDRLNYLFFHEIIHAICTNLILWQDLIVTDKGSRFSNIVKSLQHAIF